MNISIASDHRGFKLKTRIIEFIRNNSSYQIFDQGPPTDQSTDYPEYAQKVCLDILNDSTQRGILICGSGLGMSMAANRFKGIRAALCTSYEQVVSSRKHNNANIIVFPADLVAFKLISQWLEIWLNTGFDGTRHQRRITKLDNF
jgi:ribose 5-phosphate isomerase B